MPRNAIIQPDQSYSFADYFKLNFVSQDILAYFGVTLQRQSLQFPRYDQTLDRLIDLKARIEESLHRLSLTSEIARREFLIHRKYLATWEIRPSNPPSNPRPQPLPCPCRPRRPSTHPSQNP